MSIPPPDRRAVWIAGLLFLAALAAHGADIGHGFTSLDDPAAVVQNADVRRGLTWGGIGRAFMEAGEGVNYWTPLARLSHMADVQVFGLRPWGHHLTNVLLHACDAALLFLALRALTGAVWRSAFVGLLLAVHPVHVESVAWIAERRDVLGLFFGCLTLWAYAGYARSVAGGIAKPQAASESRLRLSSFPWIPYFWVCLAGAAAILSKPTMVTLPCVLWLLDFWPLRRWRRAAAGGAGASVGLTVVEKLPLLAAAGVSAALTLLAHRHVMTSVEELPVALRLLDAVRALGGYFLMLVWPVKLLVLYTDWYVWSTAAVALPAGLAAAMTYAAIRTARTRPYLLTGWLWFLGALVPMIGLLQVGAQVYAARFAYFPFIGLYIVLVWGMADMLGAMPGAAKLTRAGWAAAVVVGLAGIVGSIAQSRMWESDVALFGPVVASGSESVTAYSDLAAALELAGENERALPLVRHVLVLNIHLPASVNWLGLRALGEKDWATAERFGELSKKVGGQTPEAWELMARAEAEMARPGDAARHYRNALALRQESAADWLGLADALEKLGKPAQAVEALKRALVFDPRNAAAAAQLARLRAQVGGLDATQPEN